MKHTEIITGYKKHYSVHCECGWNSPDNPNIETKEAAHFDFQLHVRFSSESS